MRRVRAAFAVAAAFVVATGVVAFGAPALPPPEKIGPAVTTVRLDGGGTGIVRPLAGSPVAAIELWFRAPSIGFDGTPRPGLAYVAASAIAASKPLTGTPLGTAIARDGGRFTISVYPQTISISALVPASRAVATLRAMSAVYFTPVLTQEGLTAAIASARQDARMRALLSPEDGLRDALFGSLFAQGPNHYSPEGTENDARRITLADVASFSTRAFRAANATVVMTGAVDSDLASAAVEGRPDTTAPEVIAAASPAPERSPKPIANSGPVSGFGYAWAGPPITSEREATALDFVADYLFNPDTGSVQHAFANADVAINGQYVTYFNPGVMYVEATGTEAKRARPAIDAALTALRTPLDDRTFATARATFEYHVTSDVSTPTALADNFGWYMSEGDAGYAPGADLEEGKYIRALRSLTPQFVAATVDKFLGAPPAVVTLTEKPAATPPPMPTDKPRS